MSRPGKRLRAFFTIVLVWSVLWVVWAGYMLARIASPWGVRPIDTRLIDADREEEIAQAQCQLLRQKYPCALIEVRELRDGSRRVYAWLHDDRKVWISSGDRYTLHYTSYIDLYLGMAEGVANK